MNITNTEKEYNSANNITYSCQYHIIFCPKYRRKVLVDGIEVRLAEIFNDISKKEKFNIIEMEIMPDYVHLIIDCNPKYGIDNCVKKLKGISAHRIKQEFPYINSRLPSLWTRNYFASTVGTMTVEAITKYIDKQKNV